jgi:hypothetical protein
MDSIELIAEILKYSIPAVLVLLAVKFVLDSQTKKEGRQQGMELRGEVLKHQLPMRLNAYERAILYLERIKPDSLLGRTGINGKTAGELAQQMLHEIKEEYEHNVTQQLYISNTGWMALLRARTETAGAIQDSMKELKPDAPGMELARKMVSKISEMEENPVQAAIIVLKTDIQRTLPF